VAPHSKICEFLQRIDQYRGIVKKAVFECIGMPVFFDAVARLVSFRVAERLAKLCSANQKQEVWIQQLASRQDRKLVRAIEKRFVETGILELLPECGES